MKLSRILTGLAALNPFAVKVAAQGNSLFAYRNVLGIKVAVTGQAEQRAIIDYVTYGAGQKARVTKAMIGSPFAFVDARQGQLLDVLLTPTAAKPMSAKMQGKQRVRHAPVATYSPSGIRQTPPSLAEVLANKHRGLPAGLTQTQRAWVCWNFPRLEMTVEVGDAHLAGAAWPLK